MPALADDRPDRPRSPTAAPAVELPGVRLPADRFGEVRPLTGMFLALAAAILQATEYDLTDRGGGGDCGFLCLGVALVRLGLIVDMGSACTTTGDPSPFDSVAAHDKYHADQVRLAICQHGRLPATQTATVAGDGGGGQSQTLAHAMMSSFSSWAGRQEATTYGDRLLEVGTYLAEMSIGGSPHRIGTYMDSGALVLAADCWRLRIVVRLHSSDGAELPGSPQTFLPRSGVEPVAEVRLRCHENTHFVLEAQRMPAQSSPAAAPPSALPELGPTCGSGCTAHQATHVAELEADFRRLQARLAQVRLPHLSDSQLGYAECYTVLVSRGPGSLWARDRAGRVLDELADAWSTAAPDPDSEKRQRDAELKASEKRRCDVVEHADRDLAIALQCAERHESQRLLADATTDDARRSLVMADSLRARQLGQADDDLSLAHLATGDEPPRVFGCRQCGGLNVQGDTTLCPRCNAFFCHVCHPPSSHDPCSSLLDEQHSCERCTLTWHGAAPGRTHAECALCTDDLGALDLDELMPHARIEELPDSDGQALAQADTEPPSPSASAPVVVGAPQDTHPALLELAPQAGLPHWSTTVHADDLRRLTTTEAVAAYQSMRAAAARIAAGIGTPADEVEASHLASRGEVFREYISELLLSEDGRPAYDDVCTVIFGHSELAGQTVVILAIGADGPRSEFPAQPVQAFSETIEARDTGPQCTAMRGITEELLGLTALDDTERATCALLALARAAGYPLRHLGANPAARHRTFALHAADFFKGGLDGAVDSFRANDEISALVLVSLAGLTGLPGESDVVDIYGIRHRLRGGRHLGARRVQFMKDFLPVGAIPHDAPPAPPPPRPPRPPGPPRAVRFAPLPTSGGGGAGGQGGADAGGAPDPGGVGATVDAVQGARVELAQFTFPLRTLADVRRLMACEFIAPTAVVGFEFSGAMRLTLEASGVRAISVDWRVCDVGGMHAVLDARDVVDLGGWKRAYLFPPCFQQLRADRDCLEAKIADCRAFWGCALVLWCCCAEADLLVVEQPDTIFADFVPYAFAQFRTSCFDDSPDKFVRLYLRNAELRPPHAADASARKPPLHHTAYASSDARDRAKSTWAPLVNLCRALAILPPSVEPPPRPMDYSVQLELFAEKWHARGYPVPEGYTDRRARPPTASSRRYQTYRGPGDGRVPRAVVPALSAIVRGGGAPPAATRRTGLLGGAGGDRNHDLLMIGNRVRRMDRDGHCLYDITGVDTVQRHAFIATNALSGRADCRVDLLPHLRVDMDALLVRRGAWQLLPGSRDLEPFGPDSYVCVECLAQSTFRPCIICTGGAARSGHALVMEGGVTTIVLDAEAVSAAMPLAADGAPRTRWLHAPGGESQLPTLDVRAATEAAVLLVFVSVLLQPLVYAHVNGFTMYGVVLPALDTRTSCVHAAQSLVATAVGATAASAFLVGEYIGGARLTVAPLDFRPPRHLMCRTRKARLAFLASGCTFMWCTLSALGGTPVSDAAARAILACDAYVKPGHMLADFPPDALVSPLAFRIGAMAATSVLSRPLLDHVASPPAWRAIAESAQQNQLLIDALNAASEDELLAGWVDRIGPIDPTDVPASLLAALPGFDDPGLEAQPYTPVYVPFDTPWLPLPPRQRSPSPDAPTCVRSPFDMMVPATRTAVRAWIDHAVRDLVAIRLAVAEGREASLVSGEARRDRPRAFAVGQLELHAWAQGRVWDCRPRCCKMLDFQAPVNTHLNLAYLRERLSDYPDQYFVANLLEGARLDADVELQSVFVPHLISLPSGYNAVGKELRRMRGLGWYDFFPDFPFWPMYLNAQGSTARKLEPDRHRRTTEGGGPRMPTLDLSGLAAISINAASFMYHMPQHFISDQRPEMLAWLRARGLPPPPDVDELLRAISKWHKEFKPDLAKLMRDLAILKRVGHMLRVPIYGFGDDAKDYFNQLAMAECELHKLGIIFLAEPGDLTDLPSVGAPFVADRPIFVSELRLGFGTHGASNLAQRFSEALLHLFRLDMDAAEEPFFESPTPAMRQWLLARRKVAESLASAELAACQATSSCAPGAAARAVERHYREQRRLYTAFMYTDDPIWVVVGVDRTLRALRAWRHLTNSVNLIMAIPEKRHLGVQILWLGILVMISLGIVVVPKAKLLRASSTVAQALAGGQPFHVYRSLLGLLEHLRAVNLHGRNVMHGLYAPHRPTGASRFGPEGRVYCDELMLAQLHRWQHLLRHSAGVSVRRAFARDEIEPLPSTFTVFGCSDACFGDAEPNGIGGFCHGLYWQFLVPTCDDDVLSTPVLEFLGVAFNVLALASRVRALLGERGTLLLRTDALTTALVLPRESQKSPLLVDAFHFLALTEAWRSLAPNLRIQHIYGDTMAMSDPLSRGRLEEFRARCRQLGITPVRVELPPQCRELYDRVVQLERGRRLHAQSIVPTVSGGADDTDGTNSDVDELYNIDGLIEDVTTTYGEPNEERLEIEERLAPGASGSTEALSIAVEAGPLRCIICRCPYRLMASWNHCTRCGWELAIMGCRTLAHEALRVRCVQSLARADVRGWALSWPDGRNSGYAALIPYAMTATLAREGGVPPQDLLISRDATLGLSLTAHLHGVTAVLLDGSRLPLDRTPRELGLGYNEFGRVWLDLCKPQTGGGDEPAPHEMTFLESMASHLNAPLADPHWIMYGAAGAPPSTAAPRSEPATRLYCTACGEPNTVRCIGDDAGGSPERTSSSGCYRGACCQPNPACFYCRHKAPTPRARPMTFSEPQTQPLTFLAQLGASIGAPAPVVDSAPAPPAPQAVNDLWLPTLVLSEAALARSTTSSLAAATKTYAQARALALSSGGSDPSMTLRCDVASLCYAGEIVTDFAELGTNVNTLKKDDRAWEFWEHVCERVGTNPMRTPEEVREHPERQAWLLAILMLHASAVCVPKTPGRHCIKPRSALAYPLAIIRIFNRWGVPMPGYKALQAQFLGLSRAYLAYHGPKSLAPQRAEPMRFYMVRDINNIPLDGSVRIGMHRWHKDNHTVFMFRCLNLVSIRAGTRLAEWVWHLSGTIMFIVRSDLWWLISGLIVMDPTVPELLSLKVGDIAFVAPPLAKSDQLGEIHCPYPVAYPFTHDADNPAAALRDIELRCPCHGADRKTRPVIADESGSPYTHAVLDRILHNALVFLYGKAFAALFSWHSYRSGLCCALFAAGCPDAVIQLICRWMCPESLLVYRRLGASTNGGWIDKASVALVDTLLCNNAPRVDHDASAAELFTYMGNNRTMRGFDDAAAGGNPRAPPTPPAPQAQAAATPAPLPAPPNAPAANLTPLAQANAVGRRVLVPADIYPQYKCSEHQGRGWEGLVMATSAHTAKVHFTSARTVDGRPYADERLPMSLLLPL